jgi:hypothetical protein
MVVSSIKTRRIKKIYSTWKFSMKSIMNVTPLLPNSKFPSLKHKTNHVEKVKISNPIATYLKTRILAKKDLIRVCLFKWIRTLHNPKANQFILSPSTLNRRILWELISWWLSPITLSAIEQSYKNRIIPITF